MPPVSVRRYYQNRIAYHASPGLSPGVMFFGGLMSDMDGVKALALEAHCGRIGRGFVRFDYSGHGVSEGKFTDGTIGHWQDDSLAILDNVAVGPQVLVGSSMGGWQMLMAARARQERVAGLIGVAAAPDFTEDLMWNQFSDEMRESLLETGFVTIPTDYEQKPYTLTLRFIEEARNHLLLRDKIAISCPVHLLQGMRDREVPWKTAIRIAQKLESEQVTIELVKDGDHRLSRVDDIARLCAAVDSMMVRVAKLRSNL